MSRAPLAAALAVAVGLPLGVAAPARAWHPVTHAGLAEQAAVASRLHAVLVERLGRGLGLYEPLRLGADDRGLLALVERLDPADGDVPDGGRQPALGWLIAGAVLEGAPPARNRNHFLDPTRGRGLAPALDQGGAVAATSWLTSPDNAWSLTRLYDDRARAATAALPAEREAALARALVATGALVHVLSDLGEPAHVRDDLQALEAGGGALERYAAARWGRAVPDAGGEAITRPRLADYLHDASGGGLADDVNRRFFSPGTLPPSRFPLPQVRAGAAEAGYVRAAGIRHLAGWRRTAAGPAWLLDERTTRDYAEALLPEIARYAAGLIRFLYRGRISVEPGADTLEVTLREGALGRGTLAIYCDRPSGERTRVLERNLEAARPGEALGSVARPGWARHATAVYRGVDENGEPIVIVEELPLSPAPAGRLGWRP